MDSRVEFDSNFTINLGMTDQTRNYGFGYENFENNVLKASLFYEVEIAFRDITAAGRYVFEINRKTIYINNQTSYSQIEKMADRAAKCIFPILLKMKNGIEIDTILNYDEIRKRWIKERQNLITYYKGEKAEKVISKIDILFSDVNLLKQSIHHNWFFNLFFSPLYGSYTEKLHTKDTWKSPVFGNQCIEYGIVKTIQENYDTDDKINIHLDGIAIDERTIDEILEGYQFSKAAFSDTKPEFVNSRINIDYKLYKEDRSIFSAIGTFETKINENKHQKIEVELYHLAKRSTYRPLSDAVLKQNFKIFQSWQTAQDDDIIDLSQPKWQVPTPKPEPLKILGTPQEKIELFVGVGPGVKVNPGFWDWVKSIFKKNN